MFTQLSRVLKLYTHICTSLVDPDPSVSRVLKLYTHICTRFLVDPNPSVSDPGWKKPDWDPTNLGLTSEKPEPNPHIKKKYGFRP